MPGGRWARALGPLATLPRSVGIDNCASTNTPQSSRRAAGRPRCGSARGIARGAPVGSTCPRSASPWPGNWSAACGPGLKRALGPRQSPRRLTLPDRRAQGAQRVSEEPPPRWGATLDRVTRPSGLLVPRLRQAPDGHKSGGTNPRRAAGAPGVFSWLRLFRYQLAPETEEQPDEDWKQVTHNPGHRQSYQRCASGAAESGSAADAGSRRLHAVDTY
jgi:hypothetical protein